jgi:hypothetical protein
VDIRITATEGEMITKYTKKYMKISRDEETKLEKEQNTLNNVLLEKLTVGQLVKYLSSLYGNRSGHNSRPLDPNEASWIQLPPYFFNIYF